MEAALQEALDTLEEFPLPLTLSQAKEVLKAIARKAGVPTEAFARRALEEARRWTEGVLEGLWEALGVTSPPAEVGKASRKGGTVRLWCPWGRKAPLGTLTVETDEKGALAHLDFPLSDRFCPRTFLLEAHAGRVEVRISPRLFARKGRALFRARDPRGVKKTLEETRRLRPLFEAMGLPDLEEALETLSRLRDGETRIEGAYTLARKGRQRVLKRGSYFGDPLLDGAFVLGERVVLAYANGVEVVLRGTFSNHLLSLKEASIRWGDEAARLEEADWAFADALDKNPLRFLLRTSLEWNLKKASPTLSSRMRALVAELAQSEDPLEALKDRELPRRAALRGLSRL